VGKRPLEGGVPTETFDMEGIFQAPQCLSTCRLNYDARRHTASTYVVHRRFFGRPFRSRFDSPRRSFLSLHGPRSGTWRNNAWSKPELVSAFELTGDKGNAAPAPVVYQWHEGFFWQAVHWAWHVCQTFPQWLTHRRSQLALLPHGSWPMHVSRWLLQALEHAA
jgi:hypothetical protein